MVKYLFLSLLLIPAFTLSQILVGQYEFWDYYGSYVYDYSGNSRHGEIASSGIAPVLTDRGLYISDDYYLKFPQNSYKDFPTLYTDMVVSVLFYPKTDKSFCLVKLAANGKSLKVCFTSDLGLVNIGLEGSWGTLESTQVKFNEWKLYTIRFSHISNNSFIYVYLNGNEALIFYISSFNFVAYNTKWEIGSNSIEGLLYQIWWHCDVTTSIKTLSESMIAPPETSCITLYAMKPYKKCLSNQLDKFKNSEDEICYNCIAINQSCDKDQVCIQSCRAGETCSDSCISKESCIDVCSTSQSCVDACGKDQICIDECPKDSVCIESCAKDQNCVNSCTTCTRSCTSDQSCISRCDKDQTCIESCPIDESCISSCSNNQICENTCSTYQTCIDTCPSSQVCIESCPRNQSCIDECPENSACINECPRDPPCAGSCPKDQSCINDCSTSQACIESCPKNQSCIESCPMDQTCIDDCPFESTCYEDCPKDQNCINECVGDQSCIDICPKDLTCIGACPKDQVCMIDCPRNTACSDSCLREKSCIDICPKDQLCIEDCPHDQTCTSNCPKEQTCIQECEACMNECSKDQNCINECYKDETCMNGCARVKACTESCSKDQTCTCLCHKNEICIDPCPKSQGCIDSCPNDHTCVESCPKDQGCIDNCPEDSSCIQECPRQQICTESCPKDQTCTNSCPQDEICINLCGTDLDCIDRCPRYQNCIDACPKNQNCIESCPQDQSCISNCPKDQTCIFNCPREHNCLVNCPKDPECYNGCSDDQACIDACSRYQVCIDNCPSDTTCIDSCYEDQVCVKTCTQDEACADSCGIDQACTDLCPADSNCINNCQTCNDTCATSQLCLDSCDKDLTCTDSCPKESVCIESCPKDGACLNTCNICANSCTTTKICTTPCQYKCITPSGCRSLSYPICSTPSPSYCSSIPGTDICYQCNTGWIMNISTPGLCEITVPGCKTFNSSAVCTECQTEYYMTSTSPRACIKCPGGCILCDINTSGVVVCSKCVAGQFLHTGTLCLSICPDLFYGNTLTNPNICSRCKSNCKRCIYEPDLTYTICTECIEGYFLVHNLNSFTAYDVWRDQCTTTCSDGTYGDSSATPPICKPCRPNCYSCTNSTDCTKCSSSYMLSSDNTQCIRCVLYCKDCISTIECANCTQGTYIDSNKKCNQCGPFCLECKDSSTCDKCGNYINTLTVNGISRCIPHCTNVFYVWSFFNECVDYYNNNTYITHCIKNQDSQAACKSCTFFNYINGDCPSITCGPNCIKCITQNDANICTVCTGLLLIQPDKISCQTTCPEFYYADSSSKSCKSCKDNCKRCQTNPNKCEECGNGYSLSYDSTECFLNCPVSYYSNIAVVWICMPCITSCNKCTNSTDCQECVAGFYLVTSLTGVVSCGTACPSRSYYDDDYVCHYCMDNCDECGIEADGILICRKCSVGYILINKNCIELVCDPNCEKCVLNMTTLRCDLCNSGYYIDPDGYKCLRNCPDYYYGRNYSRRCELCMADCKTCEEIDDTKLKCTDCDDPYYIRMDGSCGTDCEEGHYPNPSTMKCQKCPYDNCSSCEIISQDSVKCTMCYSEYYFIESYSEPCLISCPDYYFVDISYQYRKCSPCVLGCKLCKDSTSCIECKEGMLVQPAGSINLCDESCPDRYYPDYNLKSCIPCQVNCKRCNDSLTCLECDDGYFIQPYGPIACDSTCKQEFFPTRVSPFTCTPCFSNCLECLEDICYECKPTFVAKTPPVDNSNACLPCSKNCIVCEYLYDRTTCVQCDGGFYFQPQGYNLECDKTCPDGYYIDTESLSCRKCPDGKYGAGTECLDCQKPCTNCSRVDKCSGCIENAEVYNEMCDCMSNYEFNGSECVEKYFDLDVEFRNYTLILKFEYPLMKYLSSNDIEIIVDGSRYNTTELIITSSDIQTFYIPFESSSIRLSKELILQFYLNYPILDIYNHTLYRLSYKIQLPLTESTESATDPQNELDQSIEQTRQELIRETQSSTNTAIQAAAATCVFISLINMNLANIWSFLNDIQIRSYLSLLNITMPPRTLGASKAFSTFNFIPNLFRIFLIKQGPEPDSLYTENNIETVQFLINSGKILTVICGTITTYLILKAMHLASSYFNRESKLSKLLHKTIGKLEWNAFTRLYLQTYADISFYSILNISYFAINNTEQGIDFMISCIFGLLEFISPFFLLMSILNNSSRIDNPVFKLKWSSIYEGYKPTEVNLIYNVVFLARRFLNAICIVFLGYSPEFQLIAFSVISYYSFWHILKFRPYSSIKENILSCFSEGCMFVVINLLFIYNFEIGDVLKDSIDYAIVVTLYLSFHVTVTVNLIEALIKISKKIVNTLCRSKPDEKYKIEERMNDIKKTVTMNSSSYT